MPEVPDVAITFWVTEAGQRSTWVFEGENSAFKISIRGGEAVFYFKHPVSSLEQAERRCEEFLRSWEGDLLLQTGGIRREFLISGTRAPGQGHHGILHLRGSIAGPLAEANTRTYEPWRRHRYWHIPLVASLIGRYESYRHGRERLTVLGYLCSTALRNAFGGRKKLGQALNVDEEVLRKFDQLVSTIGTYASARKIDSKQHQLRDLTAAEGYWLETVTRELLIRSGEAFEQRAVPGRLSMQSLPRP